MSLMFQGNPEPPFEQKIWEKKLRNGVAARVLKRNLVLSSQLSVSDELLVGRIRLGYCVGV